MSVTDIDVSTLPQGLGAMRPVELPATRYLQGGRTMYHVVVTLAGLTQVIVKRPDPNHAIEGNRRVDGPRAKKFATYVLNNEDWVSPAIIVRAPSGEIKFMSVNEFPDGTAWGVLTIPLHVLTEILLLDGQHRTLGTFYSLDEINERIAKTRDLIVKAENNGNPEVAAGMKKQLDKHLRTRDRLGREHISMDIAVVTTAEAKQMFADINNNAKGVNPDYTTILDQRDVVNRIAVDLIAEHPLLRGRVELGQETRISANNPNLLGAKTVADIVRAVHVGAGGRIGRRVEDELTKDQKAATFRVRSFLDLLIASFDDLAGVEEGIIEAKDVRASSMLGSSTMLRILAAVYHDLTVPAVELGDPTPMSRAEVQDFFKAIAPHMRDIPIRENDPLWMPTNAFLPETSAPQARQGTIKQLTDAMVGWARNGNPHI
jgi:DGQHR domain-containing protein